MEDMKTFRGEIDEIDEDLVRLLARRFKVCERVAIYKSQHSMPMMQPDRINIIKQRNAAWAKQYGVSATFLDSLYDLIIGEGCELEDKIMAEQSRQD